MTPQLLAPSVLVTLSVLTVVLVLATAVRPERARSLANLRRGDVSVVEAAGPRRPGVGALAARLTPAPLRAMLERQHARAGRPASWPLERLLSAKLLWVPTAMLLVALVAAARPAPVLLLLSVVVAITVYFLPDLLLLSRGQERVQKIQKELADTLDQMMIAVEAGLGFDAAMSRAASNGKGALAEELTRTLQDIRMGRTRRQAFEDLSDRNDVADLRRFVRAVLQADAYGISVGDVLRTQAAEMRMKRRQRAEEKAQQVPVKVLMPLMLCILPVLFIVVMAPAALDMIDAFSNM